MPDPTPPTAAELAAWQAACDAATEGPWHYYPCGEKSNDCILGPATDEDGNAPPAGRVECSPYNETTGEFEMDKYLIDPVIASAENDANYDDFAFIALARTALPRLLAHVAALEAALKPFAKYADELDGWDYGSKVPDSEHMASWWPHDDEHRTPTVGDCRAARAAIARRTT